MYFPIILVVLILGGCNSSVDPLEATPVSSGALYHEVSQNRLVTWAKTFRPTKSKGPLVELVGMVHVGEPEYYYALQKHFDENRRRKIFLLEGVAPLFKRSLFEKISDWWNQEDCKRVNLINMAGLPQGFDIEKSLGLVSQLNYIQYHGVSFWSDLTEKQLSQLFLKTSVSQELLKTYTGSSSDHICKQILHVLQELNQHPNFPNFCGFKKLDLTKEKPEVISRYGEMCENNFFPPTRAQIAYTLQAPSGRLPQTLHVLDVFNEAVLDFRNDIVIDQLSFFLREPDMASYRLVIPWGAAHMVLPNGKGLEDRLINEFGYEIVAQKPFVVFEF